MKPLARTERLIKQAVDAETLVYDPGDDSACCLNVLATTVWSNCDGARSVEEIAAIVEAKVTLPAGLSAVDAVWRALDELEQHHLIEPLTDAAAAGAASGMGRRELLKSLTMAGLFPAVQKITAPSLANATSPAPTPTNSTSSSPAVTQSNSVSQSTTPTQTPMPTQSQTQTPTQTRTPTQTATNTPTPTRTPTNSSI